MKMSLCRPRLQCSIRQRASFIEELEREMTVILLYLENASFESRHGYGMLLVVTVSRGWQWPQCLKESYLYIDWFPNLGLVDLSS